IKYARRTRTSDQMVRRQIGTDHRKNTNSPSIIDLFSKQLRTSYGSLLRLVDLWVSDYLQNCLVYSHARPCGGFAFAVTPSFLLVTLTSVLWLQAIHWPGSHIAR